MDQLDAVPGPVFVDPSGRRQRLLGTVGFVVAAGFALYLVVITIALMAPPGVLPLAVPGLGRLLPGPGAPALSDSASGPAVPAVVLGPAASAGRAAAVAPMQAPSAAVPTDQSGVVGTVRPPRPSTTPTRAAPASVVAVTPTSPPTATGRPTAVATATPTRTPGKPTATPTTRATGRPTSLPRPRPHGRP